MTIRLDGCAGLPRLPGLVARAQDVLGRNTVAGRTPDEPSHYLRAGGGYADPWTRDAALNSWLAASWLVPAVAGATLDMVCRDDPAPRHVVRDDQWWDQIVWVLGAWQQARVTGDPAWLRRTFQVGLATLAWLDAEHADAASGLYRGPAVMADGITGYPADLHDPERAADSFVLDHGLVRVAALSTNCLYVLALDALAAAGDALAAAEPTASGIEGTPGRLRARASRLRSTVRRRFAAATPTGFGYLIADRRLHTQQEGLGLALAVLSGVAGRDTARVVAAAHREPRGLPAVWPELGPDYVERFGRHNQACWPLVMGVWALAVAHTGEAAAFGRELAALADLIGDGGFFELYHPVTGAPDGGWQAGRAWRSEPDQTWTATAVLGCVLTGLVGLDPGAEGLRVRPCVPPGLGEVRLSGLRWRASEVTITLRPGAGASARVDGRPADPRAALLDAGAVGVHDIELTYSEEDHA